MASPHQQESAAPTESNTVETALQPGGAGVKILLNITHGFQARMLLRSDIARALLEAGAELIVCSPNADEPYFREEFGKPGVRLETNPHSMSKVEAVIMTFRQHLLMNPALGATYNHKRETLRRRKPFWSLVARSLNLALGNIPLLRNAYMAAENFIFPSREFDDILRRHQPDLIVTGTPGFVPPDIHLLRAAKRFGAPTATVMLSWDNLTSKGYMNVAPDHLLVWSDLMRDEAVRYHDFPNENIHWCGAAQFDHYLDYRESFDRAAWRREHGVPEDALLLVYGTINPALAPHEPQLVRQIAETLASDRIERKTHLWVRIHPQAVRGRYAQSLAPYEELAGPSVHIETPAVQSESLSWDLPKQDAGHLAELLAAADIVATPCSTLVIDAACVDTPVVNVSFDGPENPPPGLSVKRFKDYTHYAQILATGGIAVADDIDQFVEHVNAYGDDPALHREGRQAILAQQFNRLDGRAGVRTAELLLQLARVGSAE